jgi:formyltetrahydrofolate synthetase
MNEKVIINDTPEEPIEVTNTPEEEIQVEFTTDGEYIAAATNALAAIENFDTAIMSKTDEKRIKKIRRQSLRIISECVNCLYNEIFESSDDDANDD